MEFKLGPLSERGGRAHIMLGGGKDCTQNDGDEKALTWFGIKKHLEGGNGPRGVA